MHIRRNASQIFTISTGQGNFNRVYRFGLVSTEEEEGEGGGGGGEGGGGGDEATMAVASVGKNQISFHTFHSNMLPIPNQYSMMNT